MPHRRKRFAHRLGANLPENCLQREDARREWVAVAVDRLAQQLRELAVTT
jgi:hypothetical protein